MSRAACRNGITSVKNNADRPDAYDLRTSQDDRYYFNLKAANGQIVATSVLFATTVERATALVDVQTNARSAPIEG